MADYSKEDHGEGCPCSRCYLSQPQTPVVDSIRDTDAYREGVEFLGYTDTPDTHGLAAAALKQIAPLAKDAPFRCKGCGRPEDDCSADPCPDVIEDREATV